MNAPVVAGCGLGAVALLIASTVAQFMQHRRRT